MRLEDVYRKDETVGSGGGAGSHAPEDDTETVDEVAPATDEELREQLDSCVCLEQVFRPRRTP